MRVLFVQNKQVNNVYFVTYSPRLVSIFHSSFLPNSDLESSSSETPFLCCRCFSWLFSVIIYKESFYSSLLAFFLIHQLLHPGQWLQPPLPLQLALPATAALVLKRSRWMCQILFKYFKYSYLSFITRR